MEMFLVGIIALVWLCLTIAGVVERINYPQDCLPASFRIIGLACIPLGAATFCAFLYAVQISLAALVLLFPLAACMTYGTFWGFPALGYVLASGFIKYKSQVTGERTPRTPLS